LREVRRNKFYHFNARHDNCSLVNYNVKQHTSTHSFSLDVIATIINLSTNSLRSTTTRSPPTLSQLSSASKAGIAVSILVVALAIFLSLGYYIRRLKRALRAAQRAAALPGLASPIERGRRTWRDNSASPLLPPRMKKTTVTVYGVRTSHVPRGERVLLLIVMSTFFTYHDHVNRSSWSSCIRQSQHTQIVTSAYTQQLSLTACTLTITTVSDNGYGVLKKKRGHVLNIVFEREEEDGMGMVLRESVPGQSEGLSAPLELDGFETGVCEIPGVGTLRKGSRNRVSF
jgi:hypothetical protein